MLEPYSLASQGPARQPEMLFLAVWVGESTLGGFTARTSHTAAVARSAASIQGTRTKSAPNLACADDSSSFSAVTLRHRAGEGSRTLVTSLEGWRSTVELHPQGSGWPDSNRRPLAPKASALTKLRHTPTTGGANPRSWPGLPSRRD